MRKRSKYRPAAVVRNPIDYVINRFKTVAEIPDGANKTLTMQIKHSQAMAALMQGKATMQDMDMLIRMCNLVTALFKLGLGSEYYTVPAGGRTAILRIIERHNKTGRFTPTGGEIQVLNLLLELHDAQFEIATVADLEKAFAFVEHELKHGKNTVRAVECLI